MSDLFNRIAAQTLGLSFAIGPRPRTRFEECFELGDEAGNVEQPARWVEAAQSPRLDTPADAVEAPRGQSQSLELEPLARTGDAAPARASSSRPIGALPPDAPWVEPEPAGVDHADEPLVAEIHLSGPVARAAIPAPWLEPEPTGVDHADEPLVAEIHLSGPVVRTAIPVPGASLSLKPTAGKSDRQVAATVPAAELADLSAPVAQQRSNRPTATKTSAPAPRPVSTATLQRLTIAREAAVEQTLAPPPPGRSDRISRTAPSPVPTKAAEPTIHADFARRLEPRPEPSRIAAETRITRHSELVRSNSEPSKAVPTTIEITIGRLEIRADPAPAAQTPRPFQPHMDLVSYRARREQGR